MTLLTALLALTGAGAFIFWRLVRARNMQYWIGAYPGDRLRARFAAKPAQRHVYFCFADHYEPYCAGADRARAHERVRHWVGRYPEVAARHRDSHGRAPRHTFFYPAEEYDAEVLDQLRQLCDCGLGDVEVHLHHDNDSAGHLRQTLVDYARRLHERHGFLRRDPESGEIVYCFIHGNWALDNSRPDGRWCGVDNELAVLVETGCRADMTMPSAPSDTQTRTINSIYFAAGSPGRRKSHDTGRPARVGDWCAPNELLLVQGPLTLNWRQARFGIIPRIENAEISGDAPPNSHRVRLWGECGISVAGAPEHVFIKVHTHGATDRAIQMLFNGGLETLWTELERQYRDRPGYSLHYVSAWEMISKIRALCQARPPAR